MNIDDFPTGKEFDDNLVVTSINTIVRDIIELTDHLNSKEELKKAWREIRLALDYLSAKDSMFRTREELREKLNSELEPWGRKIDEDEL